MTQFDCRTSIICLITDHGSLALENSESCFSINNDILRIRKQGTENALNTTIGHLNINSMRNKFVLVENIITRKFCIRRNNNKVDSVETGCIADLLP